MLNGSEDSVRRALGKVTIDIANIGAIKIRIGFGGIVYYNYRKETPAKPCSNY